MKKKVAMITTAVVLLVGGTVFAMNQNEEDCPLKGTPECPMIQNCPDKGTPECKLVSPCCSKKV
jgi:hypothetical protein